MSQFAGKTAIISGGAEGIGFSIATALGEQAMNIVLADIDEENLKKARLKLESAGIPVLAVALDVADEAQWNEVAEHTIERFGKIHMLVNNAGIGGDTGPIENAQTRDWQWALDVNLLGVVYGTKVMVPWIAQQGEGGWIINVASMAGMGGIPYNGAYTATKTAVVALSESWAMELQSKNIKVSVLCPAFVQTRIYDSDRNRPLKYKNENGKEIEESRFAEKTKSMVKNGIDVSIVGKRVVEALNAGELYIFTHPNYRALVQQRFQAIDAAFERAAESPLLQHVVKQKIDFS